MTAATRSKPKAIAKADKTAKKTLSRNLREFIEEKDWTLSDFAREVGTSQPTVSVWVRGETLPSVPYLIRLSEVVGKPMEALVGGNGEAKVKRKSKTKRKAKSK